MEKWKLENDAMVCQCGSTDFKLSFDGETVMCSKCKRMYLLGQPLYSGCAESCGMLYAYNREDGDDRVGWYWNESHGSQDWRW